MLPFDHINPPTSSNVRAPSRTAILYVSMESDSFRPLHEILYEASSRLDASLRYVVRYVPPANPGEIRNYLTGYGVALDLKKTDYLALDDRRASSKNSEEERTGTTDSLVSSIYLEYI